MTKVRWTEDEVYELLKLVKMCGKAEGIKLFMRFNPDRTEDAVRSKLREYTKVSDITESLPINDGFTEVDETDGTEPWCEEVTDPYYSSDDIEMSGFSKFLIKLRSLFFRIQ